MAIKNCIKIIIFLMSAMPVLAEDIYVSQSGSGSVFTTSCAVGSRSMAWLNTVGNWGVGADKVSAGDTVHLCGTLTSTLTIQGSGSSGSPITFYWEPDAKFSQETWTGVIINLNYKSYLIFDGGSNGKIECTNNGTAGSKNSPTAFSNRDAATYSTDVTIKNLSILDLYVRTDLYEILDNGTGVYLVDINNLIIQNCIFRNMYVWMVIHSDYSTTTSTKILNNIFTKSRGSIIGPANGSSYNLEGLTIDGNQFDNLATWNDADTNRNQFHCEYIQMYGYTSYLKDIIIRNNTFGMIDFTGGRGTGAIFPTERWDNLQIYNNIFHGGSFSDGVLVLGCGSGGTCVGRIYNNIFRGPGNGTNQCIDVGEQTTGSHLTIYSYNNIITGYKKAYANEYPSGISYRNNNLYYNITEQTLTDIRNYAQGGQDANSNMVAPLFVNDSGTVGANLHSAIGSPSIDSGVSEATYFTTDKDGNNRPAGSAWDIGAYEYGAGGSAAGLTIPGGVTIR
jgi:hypothetical protein